MEPGNELEVYPSLGTPISRRRVLGWMGGSVASSLVLPRLRLHDLLATATKGSLRPRSGVNPALERGSTPPVSFSSSVTRRDDMVNIAFEFFNLKLSTGAGSPKLTPVDPTAPSYMAVVFPPQHVGEQAVNYTTTPPWPSPPLEAALSGPTRLVFSLKPGVSLDYTLGTLLSWSGLAPVLTAAAASNSGVPAAPTSLQTYIEAPWALFLSPDGTGSWHNATSPVTANGRTEIWQTRLGVGADEPPRARPPVKAVWTPGYPENPLPSPFLMSLDNNARASIVTRTCGLNIPGVPPVPAAPIPADLVLLTALGASLNINGKWDPVAASSFVGWDHRSWCGRDSYVRTVQMGYLFPFGHRAVFITITDREFQADGTGAVDAYLVQKQYVVVVQPELSYAGDPSEPDGGRQNPLRAVKVETKTTPPITTDPMIDPLVTVGSLDPSSAFWIRTPGKDVLFAHRAADVEGRTIDFSTGAIWASTTVVEDSTKVSQIVAAYAGVSASRRTPDMGGKLLAFADVTGADPGSTAQHVDTYELGGAPTLSMVVDGSRPNFFPVMNSAGIRLPGAQQIAGQQSPVNPPTVSYYGPYLSNGFTPGAPEIYLKVDGSTTAIGVPAKLSGGSATPNMGVQGLARDLGPVGGTSTSDLDNIHQGLFDPSTVFQPSSKLLGGVPLADIIKSVKSPDTSKTKDQSPKINVKVVYTNGDPTQAPTALEVTLDWNPAVSADPPGFFLPDSDGSLKIHVDIKAPFSDPANVTYDITGTLEKFALQLFGNAAPFIKVHFKSLAFKFSTGAKIDIKPDIDTITFEGPLTFVQDFEQLLASLGGPSIDLQPSGITAKYSLPLPSVGVGIFALKNLSLAAGLTIPFDGTPVRVRFDLCTRDNPFTLTISFFGGGGFFGLAIGADGIEKLEVSLEFGAGTSIDLGVASGSVSIMAGIYFSLQTTPSPLVQLTGFLKADGSLEVLGIITISVEFYLGFTYLDPGKAYGQASVTLTVKVLFFSASVTATMTKTFGGSNDPTFGQALTQHDWDTYCQAFAA